MPAQRNRVNLNKAITRWPDSLRMAGSLVTNQVRAYDLLRMFGRERLAARRAKRSPGTGGSPRPRTCLPAAVDPVDDTYRRQMNWQLTV